MATHSSILVWRIPWTEEPEVTKSWTWLTNSFTFTYQFIIKGYGKGLSWTSMWKRHGHIMRGRGWNFPALYRAPISQDLHLFTSLRALQTPYSGILMVTSSHGRVQLLTSFPVPPPFLENGRKLKILSFYLELGLFDDQLLSRCYSGAHQNFLMEQKWLLLTRKFQEI